MRCKYCGSNVIHPETQHKTFSAGKAVAGAVAFGVVGAAAGLIGKDQKGYKCGACGAFMDAPMDLFTESSINNAIKDAENGRDRSMFDYFKGQYANIQANIPVTSQRTVDNSANNMPTAIKESLTAQDTIIKNSYKYAKWLPDCPVFVETVIIKTSEYGDILLLYAQNQSKQYVRSAYFKASIYDDTGDLIHDVSCVYQGLNLAPGEYLPVDKEFKLNTEVAYKVELICEKVALSDDTVWRYDPDNQAYALMPQTEMTTDSFPRLKYVRAQLKNYCTYDENASLYIPCEGDGFWQCICGHPVLKGTMCPRCNAKFENLQELISQKNLREIQQEQVKARAAARAQKTSAIYVEAVNRKVAREKKIEEERIATEEAEKKRIEDNYQSAVTQMTEAKDIVSYEKSRDAFKVNIDYKDSKKFADECQTEIDRLKKEQKQKEDHKRKITIATSIACMACLAIVIAFVKVIIPNNSYNKALALMNSNKYEEAMATFKKLGEYKDSSELAIKCEYNQAVALMDNKEYEKAIVAFEDLGEYEDSAGLRNDCLYEFACQIKDEGKYSDAIEYFDQLIDLNISEEMSIECRYEKAICYYNAGDYENAKKLFYELDDYGDSINYLTEIKYQLAINYYTNGQYSKALEIFEAVEEYQDASEYIEKCTEQMPILSYKVGDVIKFGKLSNYSNLHDISWENVGDDIEWIVIYKSSDESEALLLSKNILMYGEYSENPSQTFKDFCSESEQELIKNGPRYLSVEEINKYLTENEKIATDLYGNSEAWWTANRTDYVATAVNVDGSYIENVGKVQTLGIRMAVIIGY